MSKLRNSLAYMLNSCQKSMPLNSANFLLYLADWKHAIDSTNHKTITQTTWFKKGDSPHSEELYLILDDSSFQIKEVCGSVDNFLISLKDKNYHINLDDDSKKSVDFIMSKINTKTWEDIAYLVSSTLPMLAAESSDALRLEELAKFYVEEVVPQMKIRELEVA